MGETERPITVRYGEHLKTLTAKQLLSYTKPSKNKVGQSIIDEHQPSAVAAHAQLQHGGVFDFSIGQIGMQAQQDKRKIYEALICRELDPALNRRVEGGGVVPLGM